jgi:hypothetical protein
MSCPLISPATVAMFTQPKVLINISSTVTMYTQLPDLIRSYKAVLMDSSIPVLRPSLLCFWVAAVLCGVERLEALLSQAGQRQEELVLLRKLVPPCPCPTWDRQRGKNIYINSDRNH